DCPGCAADSSDDLGSASIEPLTLTSGAGESTAETDTDTDTEPASSPGDTAATEPSAADQSADDADETEPENQADEDSDDGAPTPGSSPIHPEPTEPDAPPTLDPVDTGLPVLDGLATDWTVAVSPTSDPLLNLTFEDPDYFADVLPFLMDDLLLNLINPVSGLDSETYLQQLCEDTGLPESYCRSRYGN
ncbi:MAG: hypothetical protein KJ749_05180, partial [Planctomycetes bacterium]|nr:hypothetical protein [Planctomycetota bacterium]